MNKKSKNWLSKLLSHNITLLILAFVISFVAWVVITLVAGIDEKTVTIDNIPVTIQLDDEAKNNNYIYFLDKDTPSTIDESSKNTSKPVASVEVKGNGVMVGSLDAGDIKVTGSFDQVTNITPQEYEVSLKVSKAGIRTNYEILPDTLNPKTLKVYVDCNATKTFTIENKIDMTIDEDHYVNMTLSENEVEVSGPETLINEIDTVEVKGEISSDKEIVSKELVFLNADGKELDTTYLSPEFDTVDVTINVMPTKMVTLNVEYKNEPSEHPVANISPSQVKIAGPQDALDAVKKIYIGPLDFSKYKNEEVKETFTIPVPNDCKIVGDDSDSNSYSIATVSLDLSTLSNLTEYVSIKYESNDYTIEYLSGNGVSVEVCGSESSLNELSDSDITVTPVFTDFKDTLEKMKSGETKSLEKVPLKVTLGDGFDDCWIYGEYTAKVNVTKK